MVSYLNLSRIVIICLSFFVMIYVCNASVIYVPDNYPTIQQAIDAANIGDTIVVRDGIYYGGITINKPLTLKSENGYKNCKIHGKGDKDGIQITSNYTQVEGFTIENTAAGIYVYSDINIITNNVILNSAHGIVLSSSNDNIVSGNIILNNQFHGIVLGESSGNTIAGNTIDDSWSIYLESSNNNFISDNIFVNYSGLFVLESYDNIVKNNFVNGKPLVYLENEFDKVVKNAGQVILVKCRNITIENLDISYTNIGIELFEAKNCKIVNNSISNNDYGIRFEFSNNNVISNNSILNNPLDGINFYRSNGNIITENILSNDVKLYYSYVNSITKNTFLSKKAHLFLLVQLITKYTLTIS